MMRARIAMFATAVTGLFVLFAVTFLLYNGTRRTRFRGPAKIFVLPLMAILFLYDVFLNWTVFTIIFLERPTYWRETVTERVARYAEGEGRFARAGQDICALLARVDPGHCEMRGVKTQELKDYWGIRT